MPGLWLVNNDHVTWILVSLCVTGCESHCCHTFYILPHGASLDNSTPSRLGILKCMLQPLTIGNIHRHLLKMLDIDKSKFPQNWTGPTLKSWKSWGKILFGASLLVWVKSSITFVKDVYQIFYPNLAILHKSTISLIMFNACLNWLQVFVNFYVIKLSLIQFNLPVTCSESNTCFSEIRWITMHA